MRPLLAALILCAVAIATVASAQISIGPDTYNNQKIAPIGPGSFLPVGPGSAVGGSGPPPPTGGLLLEDGVSLLLLENGTDHLCLESGC